MNLTKTQRRGTFLSVLLALVLSSGVRAGEVASQKLSILTYDSLMAVGGLGPEIVSRFERRCGCQVEVRVAGDAAQMVSMLQLESVRGKPRTQIVLGIDQALWPQLRSQVLKWTAEASYVHTVEIGFTPLDFGILGWIWNPGWKKGSGDVGNVEGLPRRWADLLDPRWKRRLLLQDPRTSTPGLAFVLGARSVFQTEFARYLRGIRGQWMTLASGWVGAYGIFLKGEAPLVWSYLTSQAYHRTQDPGSAYRALVFEDGNPIQIEGAVILKETVGSAQQEKLAKDFVSFLVSREIQELIPTRQWMMPAVERVALPREFEEIPLPRRILKPEGTFDLRAVLREWEMAIR